jgi:hypothetical protein
MANDHLSATLRNLVLRLVAIAIHGGLVRFRSRLGFFHWVRWFSSPMSSAGGSWILLSGWLRVKLDMLLMRIGIHRVVANWVKLHQFLSVDLYP